MITRAIIAATALAGLAAAAPVAAGETPRMAVSHADLDLTNAAGRATLDRRIKRAIGQMCEVNYARDLKSKMQANACVRTASANVAGQVETALAEAGVAAKL